MCYNPVLSKLYTVYPSDDTVVVIDCRIDRVVARVGVGDRPWYLAFSPVGGSKVYCSNTNSTYVSVIDCVRDSVIARVGVGGEALDMLMNTRENKLYCLAVGYKVSVLDCYGDTLLSRHDDFGEPSVYNPGENKAYFGKYDTLRAVDGSADTVIATFPLCDTLGANSPLWLPGCYNSRNHKTYVPVLPWPHPRALVVLDGVTDSLLAIYSELPGGAGLGPPMLYNSLSNQIYVADYGQDCVSVCDGETDSLLAELEVGHHPCALAWCPVSNRTFVACYMGSCVSVIKDSLVPGIEESSKSQAASRKPEVTVVRGRLMLPASGEKRVARSELLDASGRKVMDLAPGENDVRHLSPGVYFLRSAVSGERSAVSVRKVVVTR